jgi:hypothetical protein
MKPRKDSRNGHHDAPGRDKSHHEARGAREESGAFPGRSAAKAIRKSWRKLKRRENQMERARVRDALQSGLQDPDSLDDLCLDSGRPRLPRGEELLKREWTLQERNRKVRSELRVHRDLDSYIRNMSRSKTLNAMIALGFFRKVLESEEYGDDHRYKQAIRGALEDPVLAKVVKRKWEEFENLEASCRRPLNGGRQDYRREAG